MAKLTVIVGVGGSGKTYFARQQSRERTEPYFSDVTLVNIKDRRQRAGYGKITEVVARLLGRDESCIIDESYLTNTGFRDDFVQLLRAELRS